MPIPENAKTIYQFLIAHGFTPNAAAGILGNIEQESGGNPDAGSNPPGSGLIQQLGYPTGQSLQAAMEDIITYVDANGSIADINAHATSPAAAALYFSEKYERPGIPDNANREQSAIEVAQAAKTGNWGSGVSTLSATSVISPSADAAGLLGIPSQITSFFNEADLVITKMAWLVQPSSWLRIGAFLAGVALLFLAIHAFTGVATGGNLMPGLPAAVPVPV